MGKDIHLTPIHGAMPTLTQGFSGYLKRSFAMLNLDGATASINYYETDFDCW